MREILFVAGEASGDLHASGVAAAIRGHNPAQAMAGIGGNRMAAEGVELLEHIEQLAVMGFLEPIRKIPHHWALRRTLKQRMAGGGVALVILVDYPTFNLKVAQDAREAGVPVLYYVTPQVWAWGAGRIPVLAKRVTRAACILRFEEALLRKHGIDATFVGHPLLDRAQSLPSQREAREQLGLPPDGEVLAVFPGSRRAEIAQHLDAFVATAHELVRRRPGLRVIFSTAPSIKLNAAQCPFPQIGEASFTVLRAATAGLLKSGTTTLEAAVAGLPHVIGYRPDIVTYAIGKRLLRIPHIGLVNIVARREVSREFVQRHLIPSELANAIEPLLDAGSRARLDAEQGLAEVRAQLGTPGAAERVATMALELVA